MTTSTSGNIKLATFIAVSLILHAAAYFFFTYRPVSSGNIGKGIVTIDFVHTAPHHEDGVAAPGHLHRGSKEKKAAQAPSPPSGGPQSVAGESDRYITEISELLNRKKIYPRLSVEREEEGQVVVGATLDREGQLLKVVLEEPSPFSRLNEAALQTVRAVNRFPPPPPELESPLHLHIPLTFVIER